jgi:hypothetical protein
MLSLAKIQVARAMNGFERPANMVFVIRPDISGPSARTPSLNGNGISLGYYKMRFAISYKIKSLQNLPKRMHCFSACCEL